MKALLAQFIFESNTFNGELADLELFTDRGVWLMGEEEVFPWVQSNTGQLRSSYDFLVGAGWQVHPVFAATCGSPAGRLSRIAFETFQNQICTALASVLPADGIILHLHGASCAEGIDDVEGELLEYIRKELKFNGRLVISLDLHANVTSKMLDYVDGVAAYRTMPHSDFIETGERAARLLLESEPIRVRMAKIAALIPPTSTRHNSGNFADILAAAMHLEAEHSNVLDISLFPVQPWMDVEEMGVAITVTERVSALGADVLHELASKWYASRGEWRTRLYSWQEIVETLMQPTSVPWILADAADATTGGAPGSDAEIIQQMLPYQNQLPGEVLIHIVDPIACSLLSNGITSCQLGTQKVKVSGSVELFRDCSYVPRGKSYRGLKLSMGNAAVVYVGKLRIVVTTAGSLCADPSFYEAVNLDPDKAQAVHVKSLMGWITGYEVPFERGLIFDTGGMTSLRFEKLAFSGERKNLYPINEQPLVPISYYP